MLEGLYQFGLLGVVDAMKSNFQMAIGRGLQIYLAPVQRHFLRHLCIEVNLGGFYYPVVLPTEMPQLFAPLGIQLLEAFALRGGAVGAPSQFETQLEIGSHRCQGHQSS